MASSLGFDGAVTAALNVSDLDKSAAWYQDVLGLELMNKFDEMGWCELKTATEGLVLGLSAREDVPKGGGATLTFGVKDVAKARSQLEAKGVRFDGETQTIPGMVALATLFDPDGNQLMLAEDLTDQASG